MFESPVGVLVELLKINRRAALLLLTGIAFFAASAIVGTWSGYSLGFAAALGAAILAAGLLVYIVAHIVHDPLQKRVLGWFLTGYLMLASLTFFISVAIPGQTIIAPPPCLLKPSSNCPEVLQNLARANMPPETKSVPVSARASLQISVQFAGTIKREEINAMMEELRNQGWRVQEPKRTVKALGANEVRYTATSDEDAAWELARAVQKANLVRFPVTAKRNPSGGSGTLEIWINR